MAEKGGKDPRSLTEEERRERVRIHLQIIADALGRENVSWNTGPSDDPADFLYVCRPGHILVRDEDLGRVSAAVEGRVADNLVDGLTLYELAGDENIHAVLDRLDQELGIGVATPDHILHVTPRPTGGCCPATEPEVPTSNEPVPARSTDSCDGAGVFVSVVDTGWHSDAATDPVSPWLAGVEGDEETIDRAAIRPYAGHGTFIAGIVRCIAPQSEIRVEGFLPTGGAIYESKMIVQLTEALQRGPDIISLSAGTRTRNHRALLGFEVFWETRLRHLKGTVLVAAAGNDGDRVPFWPAAFPWTVSVGALTPEGKRAEFSNFGSWVDVYALGTDLVNAYPRGDFACHEPPNVGEVRTFEGLAQWSGTSFSTPLVAGMIAVRMSARGESARVAADALLAHARAQARPGVGPWLEPGPENLE